MKPKKTRSKVVSRFPGRQRIVSDTGFQASTGFPFGYTYQDGQDIIDFFSGFPDTMGPSDRKTGQRSPDACHSCIDDEGLYLTAEEVLFLEA
jgi:hypothetical protein